VAVEVGNTVGVAVEAAITGDLVGVGVDVVDGDDWLQDEREIRHSIRKEQRKVARFLIMGISPLCKYMK
jgi:hypothetical protein